MPNIIAELEMYAGGGWNGHVVFRARDPRTGQWCFPTNSLLDIEIFCRKYNLVFEREFADLVLQHLIWEPGYGWLVPKEHVIEGQAWSSAGKFLKEIQKDWF